MKFFGQRDTADGKARATLRDLPEDPSPYEILRTVDQKAGENVDPDDVVSKIRDLDDEVDTKLGSIEGEGVDQKAMREAAGTIADRSNLTHDDALDLLSAVSRGDVDQAALTNLTDPNPDSDSTEMGNEPDNPENNGSGTDTNPTTDPDAGGDVDQKQDDDDGGDMSPLDIVEKVGDSDARDTVETYAESVNKSAEEAAAEWIAENVPGITVEGYGDDGGNEPPADAAPADQNGDDGMPPEPGRDPEPGYDQKLEDVDLNERVAEAVTSDEVIDEMAGAVAQKMASDDDFADSIVETVDKKGDFVTTDDTVVTAPSTESQTVGEAGAITGGNGGDD